MEDNNNDKNTLSFSFDSRLRFWEEIKGLRNIINTKDRELFYYEKKQKNMTKQLLQLEKENEALRSRLHYLPLQNNNNRNRNMNLSSSTVNNLQISHSIDSILVTHHSFQRFPVSIVRTVLYLQVHAYKAYISV